MSTPARPPDVGVSIIVVYKLVKAGVQVAAAIALAIAMLVGATEHLHDIAKALADNATERWSLAVAHAVLQLTTPHHVHVVVAALALDGVLSFVEGWGLHRRRHWAPWLIVGAAAVAVPIEVIGLVHKLRPMRVVILLVNLALVAYLARRALLEHRANERGE